MSYEQVRKRALTQSAISLRKRRGALRRARWSNSWSNFKKLSIKHRFAFNVAAFCLVAGLLFGLLGSGLIDRFIQKQTAPISEAPSPTHPSILVTPVAASGEEANLNLKLSTELLTNPKGENQ